MDAVAADCNRPVLRRQPIAGLGILEMGGGAACFLQSPRSASR